MNKQKAREDLIADLVKKIHAQADAIPDGWFEFEVPECEETKAPAFKVKVPRIPFERWMRSAMKHRWNEWQNVSPAFLKMDMDDRNHTDWWLTTGVPLEFAYERNKPRDMNELYGWEPGDPEYVPPDPTAMEKYKLARRIDAAAWDIRFNSTDDRDRNAIFLVSTNKKIEGRVMHVPNVEAINGFVDEAQRWKKSFNKLLLIAVVPNCSVDYDPVIRNAGAIITQVGSAAAHLVKVAREDKIPVIMCPTAFKEFFEWEEVVIEQKKIRRGKY